jgi:hypothetical protein
MGNISRGVRRLVTPRTLESVRHEGLVAHLDLTRPTLEIGPGDHPLLPKDGHSAVKTLDIVDVSGAGERRSAVDYVASPGRVDEAVGEDRFHNIVACAVLEHVADPFGFFAQCGRILEESGRVALAIPDMRYCFDALREPSSLGELVDAWNGQRTAPTLGQTVDHLAGAVTKGGSIVWVAGAAGEFESIHSVDEARRYLDRRISGDAGSPPVAEDYAAHLWKFTPVHFERIFDLAAELGLIDFRIRSLESGPQEFYVVLERAATSDESDRRIPLGMRAIDERQAPPRHRQAVSTLRRLISEARQR